MSRDALAILQCFALQNAACTSGSRYELSAGPCLMLLRQTHLVCCERKGSARLFFQSSSSLKCCSFMAGEVLESGVAAWLQVPVSLLGILEELVT